MMRPYGRTVKCITQVCCTLRDLFNTVEVDSMVGIAAFVVGSKVVDRAVEADSMVGIVASAADVVGVAVVGNKAVVEGVEGVEADTHCSWGCGA